MAVSDRVREVGSYTSGCLGPSRMSYRIKDEKAGAYALAAATVAGSLAATLKAKGLLTREEGDAVFRTAESLLRRTHPDAADVVRSMFMDDEGGSSLQ